METTVSVKPAKFQGGDEITINAPIERVWQLIADSKMLEKWGPPVREVTGIDLPERLDSHRIVVAESTPNGAVITAEESAKVQKKQIAHFHERRIEHVEGHKIGYCIEEEDIGIFKVITEVGYTTELESLGPNTTRVVWKFFHNPKGVFGHIMNRLFILSQQQKNRRGALESLKRYAETHR
jgi:uncharacterized protein YndB with AHSA1/START domain